MKSTGLSALATGFLSGGIFLLVAAFGLGFFFMFLPTLPLFGVGIGRHPRVALYGAAVATLIIGAALEIPVALVFFLIMGLPSWYLAKKALLWRDGSEGRQWYPLVLVFLHLTFYAAALLGVTVLYFAGEEGGLPGLLTATIHEAFATFPPEYRDEAIMVAGNWAPLIVAIMFWLWALAIYGHAWFAHRMLAGKQAAPRPSFAMTPFPMPNNALAALALAALLSLTSMASVQFFGKTVFVMMFLPYFFLGAAVLNQASLTWPSRRIFLFFIYFMVALQFWPALGLSVIGLWHHIKRLSSPAASSK